MSFVSRDKLEAFEEKLKDFHFDWTKFEMPEPQAEGFREQEWQLFWEAEQLGTEAVQLFRRYQAGAW